MKKLGLLTLSFVAVLAPGQLFADEAPPFGLRCDFDERQLSGEGLIGIVELLLCAIAEDPFPIVTNDFDEQEEPTLPGFPQGVSDGTGLYSSFSATATNEKAGTQDAGPSGTVDLIRHVERAGRVTTTTRREQSRRQ